MAGYPTDKSVIDQRMASVVQGVTAANDFFFWGRKLLGPM